MSRTKIYRWTGWTLLGEKASEIRWRMSLDSLSKNRGRACLGLTYTANCSLVMKCRYSLTDLFQAAFPQPKKSFQVLVKIRLKFANNVINCASGETSGALARRFRVGPKKGALGTWTTVFLFPFFPNKKTFQVVGRGWLKSFVWGKRSKKCFKFLFQCRFVVRRAATSAEHGWMRGVCL